MEGRLMVVERGQGLKMIRRDSLCVFFVLAAIASAQGAEKPAAPKAVPTPLREEPLEKLETAAIADLPLGVCVWTEELFKLAAPYLRAGDHLLIGTSQLALVDCIPKGIYKTLLLPRRHELVEAAAYQQAIRAADALGMDDTPDLAQVKWIRQMADKYGKKTLLLPTGEDVQRLGTEMAPYADIFLIQSQRWLVEDRSRELRPYCDKVHSVANTLRQANPKLQIWIQVGRKLEYGGGNAGLFAHAFARLRAEHPEDLAHGQVFISKAPDTQPGHGRQALLEFLEAVRKTAN
jgi:hypothetical protein